MENIGLQKGQKILVHGGSGGIGSLAIQIAKHLGGFVATTVSESAIDFVKNLGADVVIDYQHQDFTNEIQDYDAVFDTVGGETGAKSYTVLKPEGVLVSMVDRENESLAKQYNIKYVHIFTQVTTERLRTIAKLVDDNALHVHIDKVFPFNEAAEALEYVKTGHPKGKVVIQVLE
jgi:alcohol dehydrogenase